MSKIIQVPILDATPEQRLAFAVNFLGLDIETGDGDDAVFAKINAAQPNVEMIFVQEAAPAASFEGDAPYPVPGATMPAPIITGGVAGSLGRDDPRAIIRIDTEERNGQPYNGDVAVGVNGRVWQLKRGVDCPVPWRVVEALKIAVRDVVTHDGEGNENVTQARAYPWQIVQGPPQSEIDEWHKRTSETLMP